MSLIWFCSHYEVSITNLGLKAGNCRSHSESYHYACSLANIDKEDNLNMDKHVKSIMQICFAHLVKPYCSLVPSSKHHSEWEKTLPLPRSWYKLQETDREYMTATLASICGLLECFIITSVVVLVFSWHTWMTFHSPPSLFLSLSFSLPPLTWPGSHLSFVHH